MEWVIHLQKNSITGRQKKMWMSSSKLEIKIHKRLPSSQPLAHKQLFPHLNIPFFLCCCGPINRQQTPCGQEGGVQEYPVLPKSPRDPDSRAVGQSHLHDRGGNHLFSSGLACLERGEKNILINKNRTKIK